MNVGRELFDVKHAGMIVITLVVQYGPPMIISIMARLAKNKRYNEVKGSRIHVYPCQPTRRLKGSIFNVYVAA